MQKRLSKSYYDTPPERLNPTQLLDQKAHAALAQATKATSPTTALLAGIDWASHLLVSPGKQMELLDLATSQSRELLRLAQRAANTAWGVGANASPPASGEKTDASGSRPDRRFADPAWQRWPFNFLQQSFQLSQAWWEAATQGVHGVAPHHENLVSFAAQQWLGAMSPVNFALTNPVVQERTRAQGGDNLVRGARYQADDMRRMMQDLPAAGVDQFVVGRDVAATAGKVVMRNALVELIQYSPTTAKVNPEPILIIPAWIMKYYILDLSPHNSMIKYLVDQGHTVFCISWKNPGVTERHCGLDDYLTLGLFDALDKVGELVPKQRIHATGYCLGGTLLAVGAAAMARDGDERLASLTLLAAQTDFSQPGELALFIDESQLHMIESQMFDTGYLSGAQMSGTFVLLRAYDLLWSRIVDNYLLGERAPPNDLMAWNADVTRMPARMHTQYLRCMYLHNELAEGQYLVQGQPVALMDLRVPVFCVGTVTDHVAPWRSVYKLHLLSPAEIDFVLTSGGHNAGIVSQPGHPRRHFQHMLRPQMGRYVPPDEWLRMAPSEQGSWWPKWHQWLAEHSGPKVKPPAMGEALGDAPGQYVLER